MHQSLIRSTIEGYDELSKKQLAEAVARGDEHSFDAGYRNGEQAAYENMLALVPPDSDPPTDARYKTRALLAFVGGLSMGIAVMLMLWADSSRRQGEAAPELNSSRMEVTAVGVGRSRTLSWEIWRDPSTDWSYLVVERTGGGVCTVPMAPESDFMPDPEDQPIGLIATQEER